MVTEPMCKMYFLFFFFSMKSLNIYREVHTGAAEFCRSDREFRSGALPAVYVELQCVCIS